jgi:transcriptional regulator with XRE-family HTH domain
MEEKKKYRYTKQLVNMALRDGWTQREIADACRTQQSVVSNWKNGSVLAKESQLKKLLEVYGSKLRRRTFKIYQSIDSNKDNIHVIHMIKVEGEVILSFPFRNREFFSKCHSIKNPLTAFNCGCSPRITKIIPTRRLVLHDMGKGEFCLLYQCRLIKDEHQWRFPESNIFSSRVIGRLKIEDLLIKIDGELTEELGSEEIGEVDCLMLRMLMRKTLLEHGYPVEGVEEHLATC